MNNEHETSQGLVLCLTNMVAANFTANVLLAIGARPAMIEEPSEAAELAQAADAVLVNVGTVTPVQAEAMRAAIAACGLFTPWVLDPVACHVLAYRCELVREFLAAGPSLVRGNHAEIDFLRSDAAGAPRLRMPMLSTGAVDRVWTDGDTPAMEIVGGVPMLQDVTATGCAQGAVCAALLARGLSPFDACVSASRLMKRAGEQAYEKAKAPGSFMVALVDALYELTHQRGGDIPVAATPGNELC